MTRTLLTVLLLLIPATADAASRDIEDATLRYDIMVQDNVIRLSDILEGSPRAEKINVARAPRPGATVALNPTAILRIAARYRIRWNAPAGLKRIIVRRSSNIVDAAILMDEVEMALSDIAPDDDLDIQFNGRSAEIHVGLNDEPTVKVESIDYDRRSGRFTALVSAPAGDPGAERRRVTGRAWRMVEVPVLSERVRAGTEIEPQHVSWRRVRADRVRRQTISDIGELIGMAPKRSIAINRPVRHSDLRTPVMVSKGDTVTMVFRRGGMTLTASGRAVEDGARNKMIRVINERSRLTVEARVEGPGRVVVGDTFRQLSQLSN